MYYRQFWNRIPSFLVFLLQHKSLEATSKLLSTAFFIISSLRNITLLLLSWSHLVRRYSTSRWISACKLSLCIFLRKSRDWDDSWMEKPNMKIIPSQSSPWILVHLASFLFYLKSISRLSWWSLTVHNLWSNRQIILFLQIKFPWIMIGLMMIHVDSYLPTVMRGMGMRKILQYAAACQTESQWLLGK